MQDIEVGNRKIHHLLKTRCKDFMIAIEVFTFSQRKFPVFNSITNLHALKFHFKRN